MAMPIQVLMLVVTTPTQGRVLLCKPIAGFAVEMAPLNLRILCVFIRVQLYAWTDAVQSADECGKHMRDNAVHPRTNAVNTCGTVRDVRRTRSRTQFRGHRPERQFFHYTKENHCLTQHMQKGKATNWPDKDFRSSSSRTTRCGIPRKRYTLLSTVHASICYILELNLKV